jgi:hypothetical protein
MENRLLKVKNAPADPPDRLEKLRLGRGVGRRQLGRRHAQLTSEEALAVELYRVLEHGLDAALAHVAADSLDHLGGGERLAEDLDGLLAARLADDVTVRRELRAKRGNALGRVRLPGVDTSDVNSHGPGRLNHGRPPW